MEPKFQSEPKDAFLEKSEKYQLGLKEARESQDQEKAKLFRMEAMLDNAQLTRLLFDLIEQNPNTTIDNLRQAAQQSDLVTQPKIVESFLSNLLYQRNKINQAIEYFKESGESKGESLGHTLYRIISNDYQPQGQIILDQSHPLALTLYLEDKDDFQRIDPRQNVGGFYQYNQEYTRLFNFDPQASTTLSFPFICIYGLPPENVEDNPYDWLRFKKITEHEKGHSTNRTFFSSLHETPTYKELKEAGGYITNQSRKKIIWGGLNLESINQSNYLKNAAQELRLISETENIEAAKKSPLWNSLLDYALAHAKDELLADYRDKSKHHLISFHHLQSLEQKSGLYDYFKTHLGIDGRSEIYSFLWAEYTEILDQQTKAVSEIIETYGNYQLFERIDLFRWVLAQIPLDQWKKSLSNTLFCEEAKELRSFRRFYSSQAITKYGKKEFALLTSFFQQHQTKPLLPYIQKLDSGIDLNLIIKESQ